MNVTDTAVAHAIHLVGQHGMSAPLPRPFYTRSRPRGISVEDDDHIYAYVDGENFALRRGAIRGVDVVTNVFGDLDALRDLSSRGVRMPLSMVRPYLWT